MPSRPDRLLLTDLRLLRLEWPQVALAPRASEPRARGADFLFPRHADRLRLGRLQEYAPDALRERIQRMLRIGGGSF